MNARDREGNTVLAYAEERRELFDPSRRDEIVQVLRNASRIQAAVKQDYMINVDRMTAADWEQVRSIYLEGQSRTHTVALQS